LSAAAWTALAAPNARVEARIREVSLRIIVVLIIQLMTTAACRVFENKITLLNVNLSESE